MTRPLPFLAVLASLAFAGNVFAGFKLPSGVYTFGELDEAKAKAVEKGRPIAFLWSNTGST